MASEPRPRTKSYAGRQVDIELLKHVDDPSRFNTWGRVMPSIAGTPRIVSGIEKAVQRYTKTFLTAIGSVRTDRNVGNEVLTEIAAGRVNSESYLGHLAAIANSNTLMALRLDDMDQDTYGIIPDDERISGADIGGIELSYDRFKGGVARIHVSITTAAGQSYTFVIPVAAGIT